MAVSDVREHFRKLGKEPKILEFEVSTATVELAAQAVGVIPARIAKTLSFRNDGGGMVIVTAGDTKTDNTKFKATFGFKPKMLSPDEVVEYIGHPIGGVCPFGLKEGTPVYLDASLKRFETVFPAGGSSSSAIELTCEELERYSMATQWVDVCKDWEDK